MMRSRSAVLLGALFLLLLSLSPALTPAASEQQAHRVHLPLMFTSPPVLERQTVAFASDRDGNHEIYVMCGDGSRQRNLTNSPASDDGPVWSPSGNLIAFTSDRDGDQEIYVMGSDGVGQTNLTQNDGTDGEPAWSPDGRQIAFVTDRDGNQEVYVMGADGSGPTNLTQNGASDFAPVWSPDGTKIAFTSDRDVNEEVYVMGIDGSGQTNLTKNPDVDNQPRWSPDGTKIAFVSTRGFPDNLELHVMTSDGQSVSALTDVCGGVFCYVEDPSWSPDGRELLFVWGWWDPYHYSPPGNISVIKADGTEMEPREVGEGSRPAWSRDGRYIAFSPKTDPSRDILAQVIVMKADGSEAMILTDQGESWGPTWAPLFTSSP
jgi:Tol biopolymer transport system component